MDLTFTLLFLLIFIHASLTLSSSSSSSSNLIPFNPNISVLDFGRIIEENPIAILNPSSPKDISQLITTIFSSDNNITVGARGAAHSTYGQSQAFLGIIINMTRLPSQILVEEGFADVSGGSLWVDVLNETLSHGLSPRSWTDYLYLTVGGTLSVGGISGQAFKYGPQISNVLELDVITGKGEQITCSKEKNSDLFYGVLGGFGQLGIITRARIILQYAPKRAKRVVMLYKDFERFRFDQEYLIYAGEVDYLEGFINLPMRNTSAEEKLADFVSYSIEFAIYYDKIDVAQKRLNEILKILRHHNKTTVTIYDTSYFDFLNRVRRSEVELRKAGLWEVPHPWMNLFVPKTQIKRFKDLLVETIAYAYYSGPIIIYPLFKNKWNPKTSVILPQSDTDDDVVYVVSVLRSAPASCTRGTPCLNEMLLQNHKVIRAATAEPREGGMGAKQYMPFLRDERQWKAHFGERWDHFKRLKNRFDPLHILAPGQRIFKRK